MLYDNLTAIVAKAPAANGLRLGDRHQPYSALLERITRLASGLAARGIGKGDAVALLMPNGPDIFVAVHALFAIGAIAMPLSTGATRSECVTFAQKAKVAAILAAPEAKKLADEVSAEIGGKTPIPVLSADDLAALERTAVAQLPKLPGDTTAIYFTSSGSTGLPKLVPHTHAQLLADAKRTSTAWGLTAGDTVFDILPPNFAMGLLLGLTNAMQAGATTIYWNDPRPLVLARNAVLETLAANRVTFYGAVPAIHETLAGAKLSVDLSTVRLVFSGGAALPRKTFELVRDRLGITLRQAYGSSEAIMVSHNSSPDADATWNSVGQPAGDAVAKIAEDPALGPGIGELLLKSSSMTDGYLGEPAINKATFDNGWLRSGDLARIDDAGNLFIVGRSKLLIEVAGYKIDPIEVEATLEHHPAVEEAVVVGVKDSRGGQRLKAIVVKSDDVAPDTLIKYLRGQLSEQKIPTLIEFRETLPKSSAGKILRSQLTEPEIAQ